VANADRLRCGEPLDGFKSIASRWNGPATIAGPLYDEVSFIQSNFSTTDNGNLELDTTDSQMPSFRNKFASSFAIDGSGPN